MRNEEVLQDLRPGWATFPNYEKPAAPKIIQILIAPSGDLLGLGDDGATYVVDLVDPRGRWTIYVDPLQSEQEAKK